MPQPTQYTPTTDFSQQEANNASGRSTVNTAALDTEFANIETTLDQTLSNLELLQRDDGKLKDVIVDVYTLAPDVLNLMGGFNLRGLWATATDYALNDICSNGAYTYACTTSHISGASFDASKWSQFGFTSGADAAQAAASAQESATSAAGSASAASASATNAASSATAAAASSTSSSANASAATTKASEAQSSATSAANSAAAAAASASSISLPLAVTSGGTGATTASGARTNLGLGTASTLNAGSAASNVVQLSSSAEMPIVAGTVPPGTVIFAASSTAPIGFVKANGALLSRTTYSALFAAIGTTYGVGDGSTTFKIPDLRGEFLRGFDDARGVDSGRSFGSAQSQDVQPHTHSIRASITGFTGGNPAVQYAAGDNNGNSLVTGAGATYGVQNSTGTETRPRNVALLACIKY